jgi:hypothetical protein
MAIDAVIMSRSIREERISGDIFIPLVDIGGGSMGMVVFAEGIVRSSVSKLSHCLNYLLDALDR